MLSRLLLVAPRRRSNGLPRRAGGLLPVVAPGVDPDDAGGAPLVGRCVTVAGLVTTVLGLREARGALLGPLGPGGAAGSGPASDPRPGLSMLGGHWGAAGRASSRPVSRHRNGANSLAIGVS